MSASQGPGPLSAAQQARLRLAAGRLREARETSHTDATAAEMLFTIGRLADALEDVIALAQEYPGWPSTLGLGQDCDSGVE